MKKTILIIVALLVVGAVAMAGCTTTPPSVEGAWSSSDNDGTYSLNFNKDGTCSLHIHSYTGTSSDIRDATMYGTYSLIDNNKYVFIADEAAVTYFSGKTTNSGSGNEYRMSVNLLSSKNLELTVGDEIIKFTKN